MANLRYIVENWVNGNYTKNRLHTITRENKKYLIADKQRDVKSYDKDPHEYVFEYRYAEKFVKDKSPLGFRRSITRRSNTDGVMTYKTTEDPSTLLCSHTFHEVFGNDLRDIQDPTKYPLAQKLREYNRYKEQNIHVVEKELFKIDLIECDEHDPSPIGGWDNEIVTYLKELFKVDKAFYLLDKVNEHEKQSILSKTATQFHLNHFHLDKKTISFDENYFNRDISFWLFEGVLIFQYED